MYTFLRHRYEAELEHCIELLEKMALGRSHPHDVRAKTPTSASSPSLRSREPIVVAMTHPPANMTPGNSVKVVVRVRGFLQRGEYNMSSLPVRASSDE